MSLPINHNDPTVMHIDLNSCFATVEQQANPLWRGKPIVVAAYDSPNGCVVAPSIEAKKLGIKTGMTVRDAKLIYKNVIVKTPDPAKYRAVHVQLRKVFREFTAEVTPKSIDEAVLDFTHMPFINRGLTDIGYEIKKRIKDEIGEWLTVNVGISTNRFLAKLAASLHKPDGLDIINHYNLKAIYQSVGLLDLNGINTRFQSRLNVHGIYNPIQFLEAPLETLRYQVFKSIEGQRWHSRIRGWEVDNREFGRKTFGHSYALKKQTSDQEELSRLLMKLCEKTGRRLRKNQFIATGVFLGCQYTDRTYWHQSRTFDLQIYASQDIYLLAQRILNAQPEKKRVANLSVGCFGLQKADQFEQPSLFDNDKKALSDAMDQVNDKYGEFVVVPATMMGMEKVILDRISFGGVKDIEDIYHED